jgi:hypothetical protein
MNEGCDCLNCGTSALTCGREFQASGGTTWCCLWCRVNGAQAAHREKGNIR